MSATKKEITQDDFEEILEDILHEEGAALLAVPGVYEACSEHFNNEILERFEAKNPPEPEADDASDEATDQ